MVFIKDRRKMTVASVAFTGFSATNPLELTTHLLEAKV
jgi:hypothetical protein